MSASSHPNGTYPPASRANSTYVTDSKADLVSMELSEAGNRSGPTFSNSAWGKRTRLEKMLFVVVALLVAALAVVLSISIGNSVSQLNSQSVSSQSEICNSAGCISAAHSMIQNMDLTADPCDDFYQYACGGFIERVRIPDDESAKSQFGIIDDELEEQLRDILEANETKHDSRVFQQARDQYMACMDLEKIEEKGLEPLLSLLKKFGGWPVLEDNWNEANFKWDELIYLFRESGYSTDYLFDFSIATDLKNSTWRTIYFDQPDFGLSREYLVKGLEEENVGHYFNYMKKAAILLGADPARAEQELRESLNFEIKLATNALPREKRRNASALYFPMTLTELSQQIPLHNWTTYVNKILTEDVLQVESTERIVVNTPGYLKNLTEILNTEPKRNIANYMLWRATRASIGFMNKAARDVIEEYAKNITGKTETTPRWKSCVSSATDSFSAAVGKMYVSEHFQEAAKEGMLEMVGDIRAEFKKILNEITWMDPETRRRAHNKLDAIKEYIGYPPEIMDNSKLEELYQGLEISKDTYYDNGINMSIWSTNYHWKKLRETVDKTDWKRHANPAVVNAFYSSLENSIQFPAGILQGIFFNQDRPSYMNYGSIGWVIGHEITHGFDDQGRQYNYEGNLDNWWELETFIKFLNKTNCIIQQYGNYTVKELGNMNLNGITTQGENIADNGGIKEAYRAYDRWVQRHGNEKRLPGLDLNQKQLFWLSSANVWCSKYRPKSLERRIRTGAHSPGMFRVKGPFSNSKEFANDFNCPIGSTYNPEKKCEVW